jgi:uncharacterized protein YjbI with pentapeptide repeats
MDGDVGRKSITEVLLKVTMSNPEHLAKLKEGIRAWNQWRKLNPDVAPDLSGADLTEATLRGANFSRVDLVRAKLEGAGLDKANLSGADLTEADLTGAYLIQAKLVEADLTSADLHEADLREADLREADLSEADLNLADLRGAKLIQARFFETYLAGVDLREADLREAYLGDADLSGVELIGADLRNADLSRANLREANLSGAKLGGAELSAAMLIGTNLEKADLTSCSVHGVSVWDVNLKEAIQSNLVITPLGQSVIQVDNLEVAQFIYLLLNNEKIRHVIDTITSKVVLILGRFTSERKAVLNAIREQLREKGYLPVLFDFERPVSKDLTGTVSTLANMARFVIADLTDPSSVPHELATVVPGTVVPVQAILLKGQREYAMFIDFKTRYHWVLEPYEYESKELLIAHLSERVIAPAEAKAKELARK